MRNISINTYTGSFCFDKVSPLWCFLCNKIFTVVSEAPLRLSLLRLRPLREVLTLGGVARSDRALLCSPEHWSTECLFCKHRYNKTMLSFIYSAIGFTCFPSRVIAEGASVHSLAPDLWITAHISDFCSNSNRTTLKFRPSGPRLIRENLKPLSLTITAKWMFQK